MSKTFSFRSDDREASKIEAAAKRAGVTVSDFLRDAALDKIAGRDVVAEVKKLCENARAEIRAEAVILGQQALEREDALVKALTEGLRG